MIPPRIVALRVSASSINTGLTRILSNGARMNLVAENRLRKTDWTVRDVEIDVARRLVEAEHYAAGASNTATYLHGLFREGDIFEEQCVGVAWWIPPTRTAAKAAYPENWKGVLALSR